jgi:hypothetical protein
VEVRRRVLGEEHPATLTSMNNLAITLWEMGEYLSALQLMQRTVDGRARVLGPDHPDALNSGRMLEQMRDALGHAEGDS